MIVKIQRPLESSQETPPALVYNQDKTYKAFVPFDEGLRALMGDDLKIYAEVEIEEEGIGIVRIISPQAW